MLGRFTNNYVNQTFRLSSINYPNGQNSYFTYYGDTNDFRLESIRHATTNDATVSGFWYAYDKQGQIMNWAQTVEAGASNTWIMEYDLADQLRAVTIRTNGITGGLSVVGVTSSRWESSRWGHIYWACCPNPTFLRIN